MKFLILVLWLGSVGASAIAADSPVANGGFESGLDGWRRWSRSAEALDAIVDGQGVHSGQMALRLKHRGEKDWSLEPSLRLEVRPGDLIELECWVRVEGPGVATLCASTWDARREAVAWSAGERSAHNAPEWQHLKARVVVPAQVVGIQPRLIGYGPATVQVDDFAVARRGNLNELRASGLPRTWRSATRLWRSRSTRPMPPCRSGTCGAADAGFKSRSPRMGL